MQQAGYSSKTLVEKLGIKPGYTVAFFNPPEEYFELLGELPEEISFAQAEGELCDFLHFFALTQRELNDQFPTLKAMLKDTGMLWISWPKGSSKILTDLNENIIRGIGLGNDLVDVKVAAIDDDWSALKFVYRLKDRQ